MAQLTKQTPTLKAKEIDRGWHLIDANNKVLGRFCTDASQKLIGKHKANYSPNMDNGDFVVIINAENLRVTGRKAAQKVYTRYSGYPGGLKEIPFERLMDKDPRKVVENAVSGMLPKNKLRDVRMRRLYVYAGGDHPYKEKFSNK